MMAREGQDRFFIVGSITLGTGLPLPEHIKVETGHGQTMKGCPWTDG